MRMKAQARGKATDNFQTAPLQDDKTTDGSSDTTTAEEASLILPPVYP